MYSRGVEDMLQFQSKEDQRRRVTQAGCHAPLMCILVSSISMNIMMCTIELGTAIICACLPTYRPLLHGSCFGDWLGSSRHSVRTAGSATFVQDSSHSGYRDGRSGYNRFADDNSDKILLNEIAGGRRKESNEIALIPPNAIAVERRIEISEG